MSVINTVNIKLNNFPTFYDIQPNTDIQFRFPDTLPCLKHTNVLKVITEKLDIWWVMVMVGYDGYIQYQTFQQYAHQHVIQFLLLKIATMGTR